MILGLTNAFVSEASGREPKPTQLEGDPHRFAGDSGCAGLDRDLRGAADSTR